MTDIMSNNLFRNNTAVLIASFNRKTQTINCLKSLFEAKNDVDVFLVDDNSSDGTVEEVQNQFPEVKIFHGSGNLYWNRGMHLAWQKAALADYEYFIWLNNDIVLFKDSITELFESLNLCNNYAIVSGIVIDQHSDELLYGGTDTEKKLIQPNGRLNNIHHLNGNIVLIPRAVYTKLGNLDPVFVHDFGDVDYGLRALKHKILVVTTRCAVAFGERNLICRVRLNNTTLSNRFKRLYSPLGSNPLKQFYFHKRHSGVFRAVVIFFFLHMLNILPDKWNIFLFGKKYT